MKNVALIVAGGTGSRIQNETPKQFLKLGNKTILEISIEAFLHHPDIDGVKVVVHQDWETEYLKITEKYNLLPHSLGGKSRQKSVFNGLCDLEKSTPSNVLIHDAARPFVSKRIITESLQALEIHPAVDVTLPVADTVKTLENLPVDRGNLVLVQTPQSFHFDAILALHKKLQNSAFTDDISLAVKDKLEIKKIPGEKINFKITTNGDLEMAMNLTRKTIRTGYGYDIHEFDYSGKKTSLPVCGIYLECGFGVTAHSDGDVGLHALVDAILGACGKGDIGELFPPDDAKWKDANSEIFINKCNEILQELNADICNVDITIVCEKPKISPNKLEMKEKVAKLLLISPDQVNIKATTSEKMGFIGRKEGLSASAICTIEI